MSARRLKVNRLPRRAGVMVVLVAVVMIIFIVMMVFSVDIAFMNLSRTKMRAAADAAARAAGEALSRTQSTKKARDAAKKLAEDTNLVAGQTLELKNEDILFGSATRNPDGTWQFTEGGLPINAVQVDARRTRDSTLGSISLFFGRMLGRDDFELRQVVTVVRLDRDICLVVDRSSSMKLDVTETAAGMDSSDSRFCQVANPVSSRWAALSDAVDVFMDGVEATPQNELVALVSYASNYTSCTITNNEVDTDQNLSSNDNHIRNAMSAISSRVFNGATQIGAGIQRGQVVLTDPAYSRPFAHKTMIVLTDGHLTTPGVDPVQAAQNAANAGTVVHTITFGSGADQTLMQQVAAAGHGEHHHADNTAELMEIFEVMARTLPVMLTD